MLHNGSHTSRYARWFALVLSTLLVLAACGGAGQQQFVKVKETVVVQETVVVTATPDPNQEVADMAVTTAIEGVEEDAIMIALKVDEQRDRWSARQPDDYAGLKAPFALDNDAIAAQGEELFYSQDCAVCHGTSGEGNGVFSSGMNPRPINLTDQTLMERLSDDYLFWRISEGGLEPPFLSAMPSFKEMLTDEERWQLVSYIRSIAVNTEPEVLVGNVNLQVGLNVLQTYGCLACHRYANQGNYVGPDLHTIGEKYNTDEITEAIVDPGATVADGFTDNMPRDYVDRMTLEDLSLMVDFLAGSTEEVAQLAMAPRPTPMPPTPTATPKTTKTDEKTTTGEEATTDEMEATEEMTETMVVKNRPPREGPALDGSTELPFVLDGLSTKEISGELVFLPVNPFNIFINYELGMHCVGFNMTYCCMIPPYNSIQAQAIRSFSPNETEPQPKLLTPEDNVALHYGTDDNSYSEGDKMIYWAIAKDANGDGDMNDSNDNFANYVWTHLYIYQDLAGTIPEGATPEQRLHVGQDLPVQIDHGPSGQALEGFAEYSGDKGGNIVFTESRYGHMADIPLVLTASHVWDALGLPLTAFNDSVLAGRSHRTISDEDFQPFQVSRVTMYATDENGEPTEPMMVNEEPVSFIGTNPLDMPNCSWCHGTDRANTFGTNDYKKYQGEYDYWMNTYPDTSEYMARTKAGLVSILEMHDDKHGTEFLSEYDVNATRNRLGSKGPVNCSDCHGDNVQGRLKSTDETVEEPLDALAVAVHSVHLSVVGDPDMYGRSQSCQACHPAHTSNPDLNVTGEAATPLDQTGNTRFGMGDVRDVAGCFASRDAHTNPNAEPPFFLNAIGEYMLENVSTVDGKIKGLYCTNCHNFNSQALYRTDTITTPQNPADGETLRTQTLEEIAQAIAGSPDVAAYAEYYLDPKVGAPGNPLVAYYKEHQAAALPEVGEEGATYANASAGEDWWLAAAEPHCADCHRAPFVESMGGAYFPIDQHGKYSLMRYSKAHADLACQSCHESIHGLYSVNENGEQTTDTTTHQQALQFSPDGEYTGPVTCVTCHAVGVNGVPLELKDTEYYDDYYASVVLMHRMRGDDYKLSIEELVKKYPYEDSQQIVEESMP